MINKKIIVIVIIFLSALSIWIYVSIHRSQSGRGASKPVKPLITPTPTIFPTPTPIILDLSGGLSKEIEKLTPENFSSDFETLKKTF